MNAKGKKPTRNQRKMMERYKLNSSDWLVVKDTPTEFVVRHRMFDKVKTIEKVWYE